MTPETLKSIFLGLEVICYISIVILILLQNRTSGMGSTFASSSQVYLTRRGIEKTVLKLTIFFISLVVILRITSLYY